MLFPDVQSAAPGPIWDTFTGADGTALTAHALNSGGAWANFGTGGLKIVGNKATRDAGQGGVSTDAGFAIGVISADVQFVDLAHSREFDLYMGLEATISNFLALYLLSNGRFQVDLESTDAAKIVSLYVPWTVDTLSHHIELGCDGKHVWASLDYVELIRFAVDNPPLGGTLCGFALDCSTENQKVTVDNFRFSGLLF